MKCRILDTLLIHVIVYRGWTSDRNGTGTGTNSRRSPSPYMRLKRQCLERGILWEDPDFHPSYRLLPKSKKSSYPILWLRPHVSNELIN